MCEYCENKKHKELKHVGTDTMGSKLIKKLHK